MTCLKIVNLEHLHFQEAKPKICVISSNTEYEKQIKIITATVYSLKLIIYQSLIAQENKNVVKFYCESTWFC